MVTPVKRAALTLALASLAGPAIATPLSDALKAGGGTLCFTRSYDAAWLKAHPGQTVRDVRFALVENKDWNTLRISLRGAGQPIYMLGECSWYAGDLNRGVQDNVLDPSFKPTSGVGCHLYTDVTLSSAEEGGDFPVQWGDGRFIQAHLPDIVAAWRSYDVSRNATWPKLKRADRIIRLNRAPASECRELVTKFAPGLPR
jgi:hypothetical protein